MFCVNPANRDERLTLYYKRTRSLIVPGPSTIRSVVGETLNFKFNIESAQGILERSQFTPTSGRRQNLEIVVAICALFMCCYYTRAFFSSTQIKSDDAILSSYDTGYSIHGKKKVSSWKGQPGYSFSGRFRHVLLLSVF